MSSLPDWLKNRRFWLAVCWLLTLAVAAERIHSGRHAFDTPPTAAPDRRRADGNSGHAEIDFGGQWVFARTLATGHPTQLYDRSRLWQVVRDGYPRDRTSDWVRSQAFPRQQDVEPSSDDDARHDADWLMYWFMGDKNDSPRWQEVGSAVGLAVSPGHPLRVTTQIAVVNEVVTPQLVEEVSRKQLGGPLYPPVHAFLYYPLGYIDDPQRAYLTFQLVCIACAFVAGSGVRKMTRGDIPSPLATLVIFLFSGYREGLQLGQNPAVTLCIVVWGWAFLVSGYEWRGGIIWGLLAFKPVWAAAFLLLPITLGRWRFCVAMVGAAWTWIAFTLPFVGLQTWFDWLTVGREAAALYEVNQNWVVLSRDLFGLPARIGIDFSKPEADRRSGVVVGIGWLSWLVVFVTTVIVSRRTQDFRPTGAVAGFVALGAFLTCYRFMYYDVLLAVFTVFLIVSDWRVWSSAWEGVGLIVSVMALLVLENILLIHSFEWDVLGRLRLGTGYPYAWDTAILGGLWFWTATRLCIYGSVRTPRNASSAAPMSGDRISDSPTRTA
jgi:arabinofuranan 3-O-arabinosyltransferase